jgi:bifunctional non-homologous end joining protein LigD
MKFDGYRAEIAISGSEVVVYTRNGHDWTQQFKVIVPDLKTLTKGSVLLDGEIVAIDKAGRTNFSMLKTGIGAGIPLKFYAFDIFERDGQDLTGLPLLERKAILEELIGARDPGDSLQYSQHVADNGKQVFDAMCAGGHEGVIAKRADRPYIGERTTTWLKIKCTKRQEFVIGGWRPSDNGRGMASLILGTYEGGKFIYRGRVGTGFSDAMRDKILKQMSRAALRSRPLSQCRRISPPRRCGSDPNWWQKWPMPRSPLMAASATPASKECARTRRRPRSCSRRWWMSAAH